MERRTFLKSAGAVSAGSLLFNNPSKAFARGASNTIPPGYGGPNAKPLQTESNDLTPYTGAWTDTQLRHLLRRAMFGVPPAQFTAAKALGTMDAVVSKLLTVDALPAKPASYVDSYLAGDGTLVTAINNQRLDSMRQQQIINWWFDQMVQENLSIREKMTLFWTNHFVTGYSTVQLAGFMYTYLNTCRANALGNFKTFALTIAKDPAMIVYLNSNQNYKYNNKSHVNENFARELMELFTLGLLNPKTGQPNYTETDIQEEARALSGWQVADKVGDNPFAPFVGYFWDGTNGTRDYFDSTPKTFLGQTGNWGLSDVIDIIFQQGTPAGYTPAYFICWELYANFVYYIPNPSVVDAMATLMLQNNFDIAPVMKALLSSAHFYDANVIGAQLKSPAEYMGSLVREFALTYNPFNNADPTIASTDPITHYNTYSDPNPTLSLITSAIMGSNQGQQLLDPPNVKGWPGGHNWISTGTFQGRESDSYIILNNGYNAGNYSLAFSPDLYAGQISNDTSLTDTALSQALEDTSLAFTLGPLESGDAKTEISKTYPDPNYKYDSGDVKLFAEYLVSLPEFQLL